MREGVGRRMLLWGLAGVALLVLAGVTWNLARFVRPDWPALLEARFGRPVAGLDATTFNQPWRGEGGSLTRTAWVKFADGRTDLIGLPAAELRDPEKIVARADLLPETEWFAWCRQALAPAATGWSLGLDHPGDMIIVMLQGAGTSAGAYPRCEFRYEPEGWVLRRVESVPRPGR